MAGQRAVQTPLPWSSRGTPDRVLGDLGSSGALLDWDSRVTCRKPGVTGRTLVTFDALGSAAAHGLRQMTRQCPTLRLVELVFAPRPYNGAYLKIPKILEPMYF